MVLLFASSVIYMDFSKNDEYSVWLSLLTFDRAFMTEHIEFSSASILMNHNIGYLPMFISIVAAFAVVRQQCTEYDCGVMRFILIRTDNTKYHIANFVSGVLSGGVVTALGFIIYGIAIYLLFPQFDIYSEQMQQSQIEFYQMCYGIAFQTNCFLLVLQKIPIMFLYGVFVSMPAVALTGITYNPYTTLCLPFFFHYVMIQLGIKMTELSDSKVLYYIRPSAWLEFTIKDDLYIAILLRLFVLFCLAIFYLLMRRSRPDRGA
jgi:hypothetical protein